MDLIKQKIACMFVVAMITAGSGCTNVNETSGDEDVVVKLKWLHQSQFAGNYVAKERGLYEKEGLNVTLKEFSFDDPTIDAVLDRKADIGITGADELVLARANGAPIRAFAVIYKTNPVCAYTLTESGIKAPHDFIGKTIGLERASDGTEINIGILYAAMMSKLGINRSRINEVTIGYDPTELLAGETDVSTGYIINEPNQAIEKGYNITTILMAEYGVNMYADVLFARQETLEQNPEMIRGFLKSTLQGWELVVEDPESAVDDVLKYAPERTRSHETYMITSSIPLIYSGDHPIGWMEDAEWQQIENILRGQGLLKQEIRIKDAYTMEFLESVYNEEGFV